MGYSRYIGSVSYWWISEVEITRNLCSILVIFVNHTLKWASSKTIVTTQSFMDTAIIRWRDVECSIISPSHSRACPVHAPDAPHVRLDVLPDSSLYPSWQTYVTLSSKLYWTEALSGTKLFMPNGGGGHFIPAIARVYKNLGLQQKNKKGYGPEETQTIRIETGPSLLASIGECVAFPDLSSTCTVCLLNKMAYVTVPDMWSKNHLLTYEDKGCLGNPLH